MKNISYTYIAQIIIMTTVNSEHKSDQIDLSHELKRLVLGRIGKGSNPKKEVENLMTRWVEEYDEFHKPIVIVPEQLQYQHLRSLSPSFVYEDRNNYKVDAVKWKTKKAKFKGTYTGSPVDINTDKVVKCKYYRWLFIDGLWDNDRAISISYDGHTVIGGVGGNIYMSGGPLFGKYKFEKFHIFYGETGSDGTQHAIDGQRHALEIQFVFQPISCVGYPPKVVRAQSSRAILSLIFKETTKPCYYELFSLIPHIKGKGKKIEASNNLLSDFKNVLSSTEYYNYVGTSNTEPVFTNVEWIVFKEMIPINFNQMSKLWDLNKVGSKRSIKSLQPLGDRTVYGTSYRDHFRCRGKKICECK